MTTKKEVVWLWIKHSPILSTITAFIVCNLITMVLTAGISIVSVLANMFPTIMAYFVSAMYNENRKDYVGKTKNHFDA